MIEHIRDIIAWGLNEDFWSEDSLLAEGYYNTFNEVLNCEDSQYGMTGVTPCISLCRMAKSIKSQSRRERDVSNGVRSLCL